MGQDDIQDDILRGDYQSPRVPIGNRHAAWQAAPQCRDVIFDGTVETLIEVAVSRRALAPVRRLRA
ncbi:MAG: hypothetical protein WB579_10535, partial [Bryobacteraceae bacterium]